MEPVLKSRALGTSSFFTDGLMEFFGFLHIPPFLSLFYSTLHTSPPFSGILGKMDSLDTPLLCELRLVSTGRLGLSIQL